MKNHPSLGLVFVLAGLYTLTQPLVTIVSFVTRGYLTLELGAMIGAQVAISTVQIVAGCAIAWRARWASIAFALYALGALAFTIVAPFTIADDAGALAIVVLIVETLGPVTLVLLAMMFPPSATTRRADVSLVLIVFGVSALINLVIHNIDVFHTLVAGRGDFGAAIGLAIRLALFGATAVLELVAGILVRAAPVARARRAVLAYVLVSVIGRAVLAVLSIIWLFVDDSYGSRYDMRTERIAIELVFLASSFVMPLLIWFYVRRELRADHVAAEHERPAVLAWSALSYATFLIVRPLMLHEAVVAEHESEQFVIAIAMLCFLEGVLLAVAGCAVLFRRAWATWVAVAAAVVGGVSVFTIVIATYLVDEMRLQRWQFGPLVTIAVVGAVLAWSHRKAARERATLGTVFE